MGSDSCATQCAAHVFAYPRGIHGIVKFGEKSTVIITCSYLVLFIYTLWRWEFSTAGNIYHHVSPWVEKYRQPEGYKFSATQVPGYPVGLVSHSDYRAIWNWSNYCWWGHYRQRIFRVIFACGRTGYHSIRE